MKYNPKKHHRRSIRLMGYDYSHLWANHVGAIHELPLRNLSQQPTNNPIVWTIHVRAIHELPQCESSPWDLSRQNASPNETNTDIRTNHDFPQRNLPPNEINSSHTIIRTHHIGANYSGAIYIWANHVGAIHELPLREPQHRNSPQQSTNDPIVRAIHELPQCESSPWDLSRQNASPNETNTDIRTNHDFPQRNLPPNETNTSHTIIRANHIGANYSGAIYIWANHVGAIHELPQRKPQHHDSPQQSTNDPIVRAIHELPQRELMRGKVRVGIDDMKGNI